MAGIGQRFTSADHSAPWNTQSQYTMGRAMMHDCSKPITTYGGNFNKRALFGGNAGGVMGAPTFSDVATFCASGYTSRPGSSQQNGEVIGSLSGGFSLRSAFPSVQDPTTDSASPFFNPVGFNGGQSGPPRNFSEPSLFPSLSSASRTVGTDLSGGRIGSNNSKTSANDNLSISSSRNPGGSLFSTGLGNDTTVNNSANLTSASSSVSRGMKLDPSEFPPILTSAGRAGNTPGSFQSLSNQPPPLRNYVSVMSKGSPAADLATSNSLGSGQFGSSQQAPPEFSKQDFPALPGSNQQQQPVSSSGTGTQSANALSSASSGLPRPIPLSAVGSTIAGGNGGTASHRSVNPGSVQGPTTFNPTIGQPATGTSGGIQLLPNHFVANIPKNMICDQFGMLGLLKLIRVGDYDGTLNMLAPGLDLSSLHNNWQTAGELHNTFVSPCHDSCIGRPQDMDYAVPPEYLIRHLIAHRLPDPPLDQLSEETLFWLFYNCCREEAQLVVAKELYQRQWRFHKKEQIWLTRNVASNFTTDNTSEQGDYFYWDPVKAQKSTLHMTILYSDLDDVPSSFRLSSGTLSAFVSVVLPNSAAAGHHVHHHSNSQQTNVQQLQLAAYQQQQQQQQSYPAHQSLLSNNQPNNGSASLANALHHGSSGQLLGQAAAAGSTTGNNSSAATLASLFNTRQQQQQQPQSKTQTAQVSPSPNYFQPNGMLHGRTTGLSNPGAGSNPVGLITSRSGPSGAPSISPTTATTATTTSLVPVTGLTTSTGVSGAFTSSSVNTGSAVNDHHQSSTVVRSLSGSSGSAATSSSGNSGGVTTTTTSTGVTINPDSSSPMDASQL